MDEIRLEKSFLFSDLFEDHFDGTLLDIARYLGTCLFKVSAVLATRLSKQRQRIL